MIDILKKALNPSFPLFKIVVVILIILGLTGAFYLGRMTAPVTSNVQADNIVPLSTQSINKDFNFSLKDSKGSEVGKFKYNIQSAELDNQIIIKGAKATAVKGRAFLVINLKITNSNSQTIQINTRDYIRLSVNGSAELLAPDIHNDPEEIQANSTKYTRVGFAVNESNKSLKLIVGEISGSKTDIILNLH